MAGTYASKYTTKKALAEYGKRQKKEVRANRKEIDKMLPELLKEHRGKYALMRNKQIIKIYDDFGSACLAGDELFDDCVFSVQIIMEQPMDIGVLSQFRL